MLIGSPYQLEVAGLARFLRYRFPRHFAGTDIPSTNRVDNLYQGLGVHNIVPGTECLAGQAEIVLGHVETTIWSDTQDFSDMVTKKMSSSKFRCIPLRKIMATRISLGIYFRAHQRPRGAPRTSHYYHAGAGFVPECLLDSLPL